MRDTKTTKVLETFRTLLAWADTHDPRTGCTEPDGKRADIVYEDVHGFLTEARKQLEEACKKESEESLSDFP